MMMMMNERKSLRYLCFSLILIPLIVFAPNSQGKKMNLGQEQLGLSFEIIQEKRTVVGLPMWNVTVLFARESYSKVNLDRFFRFYSRKYPNKDERLQIRVYTDTSNLPREGIPAMDPARPLNSSQSSKSAGRLVPYDALFNRERVALFSGGCEEWYFYSPNLDRPNETRTVALKGGGRFGPKEMLEEWETSNAGIKVRATAYYLKHIDPQGVYYTYEVFSDQWNEWHGIFTFQQPDQVAMPREHIRFLNKQVAYIFMGQMYAITKDGGETWSVWDAEDDLPTGQDRAYDLIHDVQIAADGSGLMKLGSTDKRKTGMNQLYTRDYGQHWAVQ